MTVPIVDAPLGHSSQAAMGKCRGEKKVWGRKSGGFGGKVGCVGEGRKGLRERFCMGKNVATWP